MIVIINLNKIKKIQSEKRPPLIEKGEYPYAINSSYGMAVRIQSTFPSYEFLPYQHALEDKEIELTEDSIGKIIKALDEYKQGCYHSEDEVRAKLGIR